VQSGARARRLAAMLGDLIAVDCESLESIEDFVLTNISNCDDALSHSGKKVVSSENRILFKKSGSSSQRKH
jgi:hypothetical protein